MLSWRNKTIYSEKLTPTNLDKNYIIRIVVLLKYYYFYFKSLDGL
jgi:hypothetical protein